IPTAENLARAAVTQEQKHAAAKLAKGVRAYQMAVMPVPTAKYAKCKGCRQNVIAPKRFCPNCAKRRKLQSNNRSRMRKNGVSQFDPTRFRRAIHRRNHRHSLSR